MHLHHIGHVILDWTKNKFVDCLRGELLNKIKTAFFESSYWRGLTASIMVLILPVERIVSIMRTVTLILLFAGLVGTSAYILRRGGRVGALSV